MNPAVSTFQVVKRAADFVLIVDGNGSVLTEQASWHCPKLYIRPRISVFCLAQSYSTPPGVSVNTPSCRVANYPRGSGKMEADFEILFSSQSCNVGFFGYSVQCASFVLFCLLNKSHLHVLSNLFGYHSFVFQNQQTRSLIQKAENSELAAGLPDRSGHKYCKTPGSRLLVKT